MPVHELFAYLHVKNAPAALAFYADVFGAIETMRLTEPGSGRVGHAQLDFDGTTLMLSEEFPEHGLAGPVPGAPANVTIHLHVDNCDEVIDRAVRAGATLEMPPRNHFYGERSGSIRDPSATAGTSATTSNPSRPRRCNDGTTSRPLLPAHCPANDTHQD